MPIGEYAYRALVASLATCALACAFLPVLAWATVDDNLVVPEGAAIVQAAQGEAISVDGASDGGGANDGENDAEDDMVALAVSNVHSDVAITQYAGATMFETAAAEAKAAYPKGSTSALIVGPGDAWIDALSSAGFAASAGPILFCQDVELGKATRDALEGLGVKQVFVIGGTSSVSPQVVAELESMGISVVARLAGDNCILTQIAIYEFGLEHGVWGDELAFVATSTSFGDALSASPVAYAKRAPIFLADAQGNLTDTQRDALAARAKENPFTMLAVVGGTASVSQKTYDTVKQLIQVNRLSGDTQYETSAAIATWAIEKQGFTWNNTAFATGTMPYDALAGSVLQGTSAAPLLVADGCQCATVSLVGQVNDSIEAIRLLGGKAALDMDTRLGIADALGIPRVCMPGYKLYLDAGHGQGDLGDPEEYCEGAKSGGYVEAKLNAELANMVADILRDEYGIDLFLNDDGGPYWLRHGEAVSLGCCELVSIHFNAVDDTGSLSLIHDTDASPLSAALQERVHPYLLEGTGLHDCGMESKNVAILAGPLPAVILEVCFIDVPSDMKQYQARKSQVAHKIAEGIVS